MVAFELVLYFLAALAVCCWVGYGPARTLLHGSVAAYRAVLLPVLGLATIIILSSWLNSAVLPMRIATPVILGLASAVNLMVWLRTRRIGLTFDRWAAAVLGLMAAVYVLGVAPLLHAGSTAFVGVQWDLEIYLPLTEYLKEYAGGAMVPGPPNPLLVEINGPAVRGGSGWGFSYFDAVMGTVLGWPSFESFRPGLQFVSSLSAPAVFLFCRGGLQMGTLTSLSAASLAGLNGLNLWIASIGLAGHAVALVLLPVSLTALRWVTIEGSWRKAVLAGGILAPMLLAFYTGALVVFAPAAAVLCSVCVWKTKRRALPLISVGLVTLLGAVVGHLRFLELVPLYAQLGFSGGWNVREFSPLGEGFGLVPYRLVMDRLGETPPGEVWALAAVLAAGAVIFCLAALTQTGWDRTLFLSCFGAWVVFGLYLRFAAAYPYGFFKLLSLASFVFLAGAVQGFAGLMGLLKQPVFRRAAAAYWVLFLPLMAINIGWSIRYFWEPDPHELPRQVWELERLSEAFPEGARVYFPAQEGQDKSLSAMVAYFLMRNPLVGHLPSQYGRLPPARPDAEFDYLALPSDRRAWELGLSQDDLVWHNEVLALYRRPRGWLTSVDLASTTEAMRLESGEELTITLGHEEWSISNGRERLRGTYRRGAADQQADLLLASFGQLAVQLRSGGEEETRRLPQGLVGFRTPPLSAPAAIQLSPLDGRPAWLVGMRVADSEATQGLRQGDSLLLVQPKAEVNGATARLSLDYLYHDTLGGYAAAAVEVYRKSGASRELPAAAFWRLADLRGRGGGKARLDLDFGTNRCDGRAMESSLGPGDYEAHLAIYYVNQEVLRWPLFRVRVSANGTTSQALNHPAYGVVTLEPPRDVPSLREALPAGKTVYLPPGPHPDYSFGPVAARTLGFSPATRAGHALLPAGEEPEGFSLRNAKRVWSNGEATLFRAEGSPEPAERPGELLLRGLAEVRAGQAAVRLPELLASEAETIIGIDIYGERACDLEHYGYWGARAGDLKGNGQAVLDLTRHTGTISGATQTWSQTFPVTDGRFRAFLFTKKGDHFETAPLFDFVLQDGQVEHVQVFPIARLKVG